MNQLDLLGATPTPPDLRLTHRQRIALEYIGHHAPVSSDELGAFLHEDRRARGGKGHSSDTRCDWCHDEGRHMGAALRAKSLVRHRNGEGGGWHLTGQASAAPSPTSQLGPDDEWPDGF